MKEDDKKGIKQNFSEDKPDDTVTEINSKLSLGPPYKRHVHSNTTTMSITALSE